MPLVLRRSRIRVLEETHFELDPKQPRDGSVDDLNIEFAGLDKLGDLLEVAIRVTSQCLYLCLYLYRVNFNRAYNEPPPISTSVPAFSSCVVTASMSMGSLSQRWK